jgi:SpoVK/Ycf46/Vps4 family AAA+-type ATPase
MTGMAQSQYIRFKNPGELIRRWIAIVLLKADLESHFIFSGIDKSIVRGFDTSVITKENHTDTEFMRGWLTAERDACRDLGFDEGDVFAKNTMQISRSMGLNSTELAILRFGCLINCYRPLDAAADICGDMFTEVDLCDLLSELLKRPFQAVYDALHPSGLLRKSGLVRTNGAWMNSRHLSGWLMIPETLARQVFRAQENDDILLDAFYRRGPKSTLTLADFTHMRKELLLVKDYLKASYKTGAVGANVLLWGRPGTGKTEMARYLAQSLRKRALEINTVDSDEHALKSADRFDCFRFCQGVMRQGSSALVIFDEVEDVLSDDTFARMGFQGATGFSKGLINNVLENNIAPTIWITNTVDGIDPAYLRRFDIVRQLKTPLSTVKKRIARRVFRDLPLENEYVDRIVANRAVTPAHMQKVTKICNRMGVETSNEARSVVDQVLNGDLEAINARPIKKPTKINNKKKPRLKYRSSLINCDMDIGQLTKGLHADSNVRMCLFGPPGTGKTAWASHLAKSIGRPLLVKQAADILDKYIGGTEKQIANTFREALSSRSVLLLDEVDSFLPDRSNATQHYQISQANQFLTAMEQFEGILLCTTNLMENLDPATMRRFDFKISFDYLKSDQACQMAADLFAAFEVPVSRQGRVMLKAGLDRLKLSQGDFATLLRRHAALGTKPKVRKLVEELKNEAGFRKIGRSRPIGFVHCD